MASTRSRSLKLVYEHRAVSEHLLALTGCPFTIRGGGAAIFRCQRALFSRQARTLALRVDGIALRHLQIARGGSLVTRQCGNIACVCAVLLSLDHSDVLGMIA